MNPRTFDTIYFLLFADGAEWDADTLVNVRGMIAASYAHPDAPVVDVPEARKLAALDAVWSALEAADEWDADLTATIADIIRNA